MQYKLEQQHWIFLFGCLNYYRLDTGNFAGCFAVENSDEAEG